MVLNQDGVVGTLSDSRVLGCAIGNRLLDPPTFIQAVLFDRVEVGIGYCRVICASRIDTESESDQQIVLIRWWRNVIRQHNLQMIIESTEQSGASVVLLGIRIPGNYGRRYTEAFEGVYRDLASELGVPWIEFFMEGIALNEELMQDDGIHPNAEAQPILLDNAWPIIEQALTNKK